MEETKIWKTAVMFLLLIAISLGGHYWQLRNHRFVISGYREAISEENLTQETEEIEEKDTSMYPSNTQNILEDRVAPDDELDTPCERQKDIIRSFILSYFTFTAGEEEARIDNVAEFVADEMLELMREALDENPGGNYHLSLEASNINIYAGDVNEFLATFNVAYESDITRSMTQILVVRFIMDEEQIREFVILSASEVFDFD